MEDLFCKFITCSVNVISCVVCAVRALTEFLKVQENMFMVTNVNAVL